MFVVAGLELPQYLITHNYLLLIFITMKNQKRIITFFSLLLYGFLMCPLHGEEVFLTFPLLD